jgi:hypothetical protein
LRKRRKHPAVVPEIKPPVLPPLVRRRKGGRDVLLSVPRPQLEGAATVPHRHTNLLKGKCAIGPFLSILVIECQHKWSCVNLCQMMDKVKINIKVCF